MRNLPLLLLLVWRFPPCSSSALWGARSIAHPSCSLKSRLAGCGGCTTSLLHGGLILILLSFPNQGAAPSLHDSRRRADSGGLALHLCMAASSCCRRLLILQLARGSRGCRIKTLDTCAPQCSSMQWSVCLRITLVVLLMRRWQQVRRLLAVWQSWHIRLLLLLLQLLVLQLLIGLLLPVR